MEKQITQQYFKSEEGSFMGSLPTYTFDTSKVGYVLWSDIQRAFAPIYVSAHVIHLER